MGGSHDPASLWHSPYQFRMKMNKTSTYLSTTSNNTLVSVTSDTQAMDVDVILQIDDNLNNRWTQLSQHLAGGNSRLPVCSHTYLGRNRPNLDSIPLKMGTATLYPPMWSGLVERRSAAVAGSCASEPCGRLWRNRWGSERLTENVHTHTLQGEANAYKGNITRDKAQQDKLSIIKLEGGILHWIFISIKISDLTS